MPAVKQYNSHELPENWPKFVMKGGPLDGQTFQLPPYAELYHHRESREGRVFEYELSVAELAGKFVKELPRVNNRN